MKYIYVELLSVNSDFGVYLICLPLKDLEVILGMKWLGFNHVHINFYNKSVRVLAPVGEEEGGFLTTRRMEELLHDEARVFALFVSLSIKSWAMMDELSVVHEYPEVFPDDI